MKEREQIEYQDWASLEASNIQVIKWRVRIKTKPYCKLPFYMAAMLLTLRIYMHVISAILKALILNGRPKVKKKNNKIT